MGKKRADAAVLGMATLLALGLIAWAAGFWIAPVVQFGYRPAAYTAPRTEQEAQRAELAAPNKLNTADGETLMRLPGIGEKRAAAIVAYREEHGPFASPDELVEISGISQRMVDQWAGRITLAPEP